MITSGSAPVETRRRTPSGLHAETLDYGDCAQRVAEFRNANRETARDPAYFNWRYQGRPCAQGAFVSWVLDASGTPVASASVIPHDFFVVDGERSVGVVGDISVLPEFRGRGIALELLQEVRHSASARGLSACFVLPNAEATGSLRRAGWNTVGEISRFMRVLSMRGRLVQRFGVPGRAAAPLVDMFLTARAKHGARRAMRGYQFGTVRTFDAAYDELWRRTEKKGRVIAVRSRQYLHWRYLAKPNAPYRIFDVRRNGELRAYVIYYIDEETVCIDDFLALDAAAADVLSRELISLAHANRWGDAIQARFVADTSFCVPWRGGGFARRADVQSVMWCDAAQTTPVGSKQWFVTPGDKDV